MSGPAGRVLAVLTAVALGLGSIGPLVERIGLGAVTSACTR